MGPLFPDCSKCYVLCACTSGPGMFLSFPFGLLLVILRYLSQSKLSFCLWLWRTVYLHMEWWLLHSRHILHCRRHNELTNESVWVWQTIWSKVLLARERRKRGQETTKDSTQDPIKQLQLEHPTPAQCSWSNDSVYKICWGGGGLTPGTPSKL